MRVTAADSFGQSDSVRRPLRTLARSTRASAAISAGDLAAAHLEREDQGGLAASNARGGDVERERGLADRGRPEDEQVASVQAGEETVEFVKTVGCR